MQDRYIYRIDSTLTDGSISWRCTNKKCKGRLKTDSTMTEVITSIQCEHNHDSDVKKKTTRKTANTCNSEKEGN